MFNLFNRHPKLFNQFNKVTVTLTGTLVSRADMRLRAANIFATRG
jgi:pterin-4a-carbinolamine dehydratase